jgi:glyoxylase-like metal-dependent hydrolase (beta-lactamase superfamily II)
MMSERLLELRGTRVWALTDCAPAPLRWTEAFANADPATRPDLSARWFADGLFHTRFGTFVLRHAGRTVLVDAGMGPGPVAYFPGLAGTLPERLARIGVAPGEIDTVVFTHLHIDHVGWACDAQGRPTFPAARYLVAEQEWRHWSENGERAGRAHHVEAIRRHVRPLAQAGRLVPVASETEIIPGAWLRAAAGHSPGHHVLEIDCAGRKLLLAGDLWHCAAQIGEPAWCHRADMDPEAAMATRRRIAAWVAAEGAVLGAGHLPLDIAFGEIAGGDYVPLA